MKEFFKKILFGKIAYDNLIEGMYAHQYDSAEIKEQIKASYQKKYNPEITPLTDPLKFDPLNPPLNWVYDPYYEMWIELN